ncbi:hypothetical protein P9112_002580 [Eukaryota sp. TZLM1-RC]
MPSIPSRSVTNLHLAVVKLHKAVLNSFEDLDISRRLSVIKIHNPVFGAFLSDVQNCTSLISQQPRPYGLHLTNEAWKQNMRWRLGLYPSGLLDTSACICNQKPSANFCHFVSCKKFLQYRSVLHNAVHHVTYEMFKCYNFNCKVEPLLKHYSDNTLFDARRGDLIALFVDSSQVVVDFTTVDPFASIYRDDVLVSSNGQLNKAEVRKRDKYVELLNDLNKNLYLKFSFVPFAFSIFGNGGQSSLNFLNDFDNLCRSSGKNYAGYFRKNRIIFALYRSVSKYLNLMMSKLYKDSSTVLWLNVTFLFRKVDHVIVGLNCSFYLFFLDFFYSVHKLPFLFMFSARKATIITGACKESVLPHVPAQNPANLIAPYLSHTGRESVSRYVEA